MNIKSKLSRFVGCILLVVVTVAPTSPPAETITVGIETLQLGMDEAAVLNKFDANTYKLAKVALASDQRVGSSWLVYSKHPDQLLALLSFQNGKLSFANKTWGDEDQRQAVAFAEAFYGAAATFTSEGKHNCYLETQARQGPGAEVKEVKLACGGKNITVAIVRDQGKTSVSISEILSRKLPR